MDGWNYQHTREIKDADWTTSDLEALLGKQASLNFHCSSANLENLGLRKTLSQLSPKEIYGDKAFTRCIQIDENDKPIFEKFRNDPLECGVIFNSCDILASTTAKPLKFPKRETFFEMDCMLTNSLENFNLFESWKLDRLKVDDILNDKLFQKVSVYPCIIDGIEVKWGYIDGKIKLSKHHEEKIIDAIYKFQNCNFRINLIGEWIELIRLNNKNDYKHLRINGFAKIIPDKIDINVRKA